MTREEILSKVINEVGNWVDFEIEIYEDSHLREDLYLDSFDIKDIFERLEDEFKITFPDGEVQTWRTVLDIVEYVEKLV